MAAHQHLQISQPAVPRKILIAERNILRGIQPVFAHNAVTLVFQVFGNLHDNGGHILTMQITSQIAAAAEKVLEIEPTR